MVNFYRTNSGYRRAVSTRTGDRIVCAGSGGIIDSSFIPIDLGANKYTRSVSPPASPAAGDLWDELGNDWLLWRYSGTRWMSNQIFQVMTGVTTGTGNTDLYLNPDFLSVRYDIFLLAFTGVTYLTPPSNNSTTAYMTVQLKRMTAANAETIISAMDTRNNAAGTYAKFRNSLNLLVDTSAVTGLSVRHGRAGVTGVFVGHYGAVFRWVRV